MDSWKLEKGSHARKAFVFTQANAYTHIWAEQFAKYHELTATSIHKLREKIGVIVQDIVTRHVDEQIEQTIDLMLMHVAIELYQCVGTCWDRMYTADIMKVLDQGRTVEVISICNSSFTRIRLFEEPTEKVRPILKLLRAHVLLTVKERLLS